MVGLPDVWHVTKIRITPTAVLSKYRQTAEKEGASVDN